MEPHVNPIRVAGVAVLGTRTQQVTRPDDAANWQIRAQMQLMFPK